MEELDDTKLREIYTIMVRIRVFEERALLEYRKGFLLSFVYLLCYLNDIVPSPSKGIGVERSVSKFVY